MHIIKNIFIFLFPIIISFQTHSLQVQNNIDFNGKKYSVPLPEGYCNISEELKGISKIKELRKIDDKSVPKVIFSSCNINSDNSSDYPWGYISFELLNDDSINSQLSYNHSIKEIFEESDIIERLANFQNQLPKDYHKDLESNSYDKMQIYPLVMWSDENVIVYVNNNQINFSDKIEHETEIISSSYLDKVLVHFHLFTISNKLPRYEKSVINFVMNSTFISSID